ncbi:mrps-16 [Cordylochernes scorpioides]|uniref:Small ribosomal subunit protein bS16m n=1 Tax=Cordylochernes scorpioides TaxID=51811 RepID=A0ABY6LMJ0_9ARAC|nr:mrps-16 [Cordylochernes scorpioides]
MSKDPLLEISESSGEYAGQGDRLTSSVSNHLHIQDCLRVAARHVKYSIRLVNKGCTNRPFYHIVVDEKKERIHPRKPTIETLGSYDPLPNIRNEKLVAISMDRLKHWISQGAEPSVGLSHLLVVTCLDAAGLGGIYPIHPRLYWTAWKERQRLLEMGQEDDSAAMEVVEGGSEEQSSEDPKTS